ncbi:MULTISPECIES: TauD/TfdA family dioxygenase [unclassified Duganella]|jgi:taurine dioxygenase|uniref:TauD/TfdA dioxygenase family protein n=1 Tax=unclassified Duganella TaxID=2636909 RepID=UPI00087FD56B|nr:MULTISPECIES: TauD/TfdA family dioxygenase [unclassified Duganella]SDG93821.1 taurine dioxygenase [Duganella sp. OV458]SDJ48540.1 taurine dioxygenase [Duganella sp. OV510]
MNITPLSVGFGAEISGADLRLADDSMAQQLRAALLQYGMLVIRDQSFTPPEQIAASRLFGSLETFPTMRGQLQGWPEIFRVASRPEDGHVEVGRYWHSDGSFREDPTPISFWYSEVQSEEGGDTLFTDLQQAYAELQPDIQQEFDGLHTAHRNGVMHPLVLKHPKTGVPALYLNIGLTAGVLGHGPDHSRALMEAVDRHYSRDGATYRHHWLPGDVVVADNLRVAHKATPITPNTRRILNRTTVRADGVIWHDNGEKQAA